MIMRVSAPGKLFIAGEWAILEPYNFGIVSAIDKRIFAKIKKSPDENLYLTLKDFGINNLKAEFSQGKLKFLRKLKEKERKILIFPKTAIETTLRYLGSFSPFQLKIWGEKEKLGLGFSSACTVAVISALLYFHKKELKKEEIFKLSLLSHFLSQKKEGSGFDVAASVFGGIFAYRRFDPQWLENQLKKRDLKEIVKEKWPNLYIKKLPLPKNLELLIGWTGKPSLTSQLIKKFQKWREKNQRESYFLLSKIGKLVKELIKFWQLENREKILELIRKNEEYLRELGKKANLKIETEKLNILSEIATKFGGAGKLSGAGGGDCGIGICFDKKIAQKIKKEWKKNNILPIKAKIDFFGIKIMD